MLLKTQLPLSYLEGGVLCQVPLFVLAKKKRAKSTDRDKLTAKQPFCHSDFVTNFVILISSQSEGLGKMALEIVEYF